MYDAVIIGAGPGGYSCATEIASLGGRALIIERERVGGTCTNYGCIPTKALISSAGLIEDLAHSSRKGIDASYTINFEKMMKRKNRIVNTLVRGIKLTIHNKGIDFLQGEARIISENRVRVGSQEIEARNIVIATGSEPIKIASGENILTSREILELTSIPSKLVIIGGGVIGFEFAIIFQTLGSCVTIIEAMETILPDLDHDLSAEIERIAQRKGITILVEKKAEINHGISLDGKEIPFDKVLVAVGRRPHLPELSGIDYGTVNGKMQTEIDTIYAVGDVTGKNQLAHVATMQGIVAAHNIMGQERIMNYACIPNCIYTLPEIASVGVSETEGHDVYRADYAANARARCSDKLDGFMKIVVDKKSRQIKGVHIIGENATDLIATAVTIIEKKVTREDVLNMIFPHPTYSELFIEALK
ncbi:MAG: dihydrolipoyl dehydrogenase [Candidatus Scalindua sp. AMX11]|nr:MAG: dihydrolipoyl dehydrogenase [Candidatus Scalindua sp.]NOG85116.1 dihydrolipoyl dehydrogenase [Planctomycetota bacterium]RZV69301.1 MAG: dihydrolipoyl dehydrogenase [Candidatus Scalindua sp. SCAELEC01]TDE66787.1 MAG: dihydrolipoyl dehydrogenase [Candidatus Scalindua sp. AMX11]GJQ60402.1 MAG: dihydrolipoyl dehydrogenase [Candidatus Scalindua sp.]